MPGSRSIYEHRGGGEVTEQDLESVSAGLRSAGYRTIWTQYEENAFDSWFVDFLADDGAAYRAIWDGRDRWLILQMNVAERFADRWIGRDRNTHNVNALLAALADTAKP